MTHGTVWNDHPEWGPVDSPYHQKKLKERAEAAEKSAKQKAAARKRKAAKDAEPKLV